MVDITEEKIRETANKIAKEFKPEKIILFGSYAWGNPTKDSDVDLLVIMRSQKSKIERERELRRFLFPSNVALDILVYTPEELEKSINQSHNLFIEDILRNGKMLYEKTNDKIIMLPRRRLMVLS